MFYFIYIYIYILTVFINTNTNHTRKTNVVVVVVVVFYLEKNIGLFVRVLGGEKKTQRRDKKIFVCVCV